MSKPTLGRGLGDLLGTKRASDQPSAARMIDVGLRILIDGAPRESVDPPPAPASNASSASSSEASRSSLRQATVIAVLASADVALLGWTVYYAVTHQYALEWFGMAGCILSTLVAAACGCAAVLFSRAGE